VWPLRPQREDFCRPRAGDSARPHSSGFRPGR
jgi:hypothetical protein